MEITITKESLVSNLVDLYTKNLIDSCNDNGLDDEEKNAYLVLHRKRINQDAENIADLIFKAYEDSED